MLVAALTACLRSDRAAPAAEPAPPTDDEEDEAGTTRRRRCGPRGWVVRVRDAVLGRCKG